MDDFEMSNHKLLDLLPREQAEKVFHQKMCDIEPCFLGFVDIYERLSEIIPKHFTVIDLGCAYNPQCFFFQEHKQYISVDISDCEKFKSDNCTIYNESIEDFIKNRLIGFDLEETFAICSYVPPWGGDNIELVRKSFKNVFTYYPHGGFEIVI
jgi:hypothetical protein